jgi:uncharacterized protein YodC (DUF2158 family)
MFKTGDVVQLKSGGPLMTVAEVNGDDVDCRWFVGNEEKSSSFPSEMLKSPSAGPKAFFVPPPRGRRPIV